MRTSISNLNGKQQNALNHLSKNLKQALKPLMIICYGHRSSIIYQSSAFSRGGLEKKSQSTFDIFILVSDQEILPDSSILEIARRNCTGGTDNMMIFRMKDVLLALQNKSRFFSGIFRNGILLYGTKEVIKVLPHPLPSVCFTTMDEKKSLSSLLKHAQQCLKKVESNLESEYSDPYLSIIYLNESCIYIARYYILAYWGLEMDGELKVLLNFTANANNTLIDLFPCNTIEESILYHVINLSFIDEGFYPGPLIIQTLFKRVSQMLAVSQNGAQKKVSQLLIAG